MARLIHRYQCGFCKVTVGSTVKAPYSAPIKCCQCHQFMRFLWSTEIDEAEWQRINRAPLEYISTYERANVSPEQRDTRCARRGCDVWRPKRELLNGRFCSEACGAADSVALEALEARLETMYQQKPWLRPQAKETA